MKEIIDFLRQLEENNNRVWFNEHKEQFLKLQARFHDFVDELINEISRFDPAVAGLKAKDCTYRIYRDTRFSEDKSPYKRHLGAFICPGGKKSGYSGYYFHVSTGLEEGYPSSHMLAVGDYCCDSKVLQVLREDISGGDGDFEAILNQTDSAFHLDFDGALKRNPKGFPADAPYSQYLRLKNFCLTYTPDNDFICSDHLAQRVAGLFKSTRPFLDYINRAISYVREEERELRNV